MNIEEQKHRSKNCPLFWWTYDTRKTSWKQLHYKNSLICQYVNMESQSKHGAQHGNPSKPIKIWCCHGAFANGDTFLGELSNLGDHMTCIHAKNMDKHGAYMFNLQLVCCIFCQNTLPNFAAAFKYIFSKKANSTLRPRSRACFVSSAPSHQACNSSKVPR